MRYNLIFIASLLNKAYGATDPSAKNADPLYEFLMVERSAEATGGPCEMEMFFFLLISLSLTHSLSFLNLVTHTMMAGPELPECNKCVGSL